MRHNNPGSSIVAQLIPPGSVGVEIGVWEGGASEKFLKSAAHVHLVDPWPDRDDQHQRVVERFRDRSVTIHRMTSTQFFLTFIATKLNREKVDWVYIDGLHDYESVKADLHGARAILKPGGVIYGDDYGKKEGVAQAVDEFAPHRKLLGLSQYEIA